MEQTNRKMEWLFLFPLLLQWAVYIRLQHQLPPQIATHFTTGDNGEWMANGYSSPLQLMLITTGVYALVYFSVNAKSNRYINVNARYLFLIKGLTLLLVGGLDSALLWSGAHHNKLMEGISTPMTILLFFAINAFVFLIFRYGMRADKGGRPLSDQYYNIIWVLMHLLVSYALLLPLASVAGIPVRGNGKGFYLFLMAFLAIMGNLFYNIRPNAFIGIRTPWTLKDEHVWRKTHRLSGILLVIAGTAGFIGVLLLPGSYLQPILMLVIGVGTIVPAIFSYIFYRQQISSIS